MEDWPADEIKLINTANGCALCNDLLTVVHMLLSLVALNTAQPASNLSACPEQKYYSCSSWWGGGET